MAVTFPPPSNGRQANCSMVEQRRQGRAAARYSGPNARTGDVPAPGRLSSEEVVIEALTPLVASENKARCHFTGRPLVDQASDETYVVQKMWARQHRAGATELAAQSG
jgi:hypothetical protein